MPTPFSFVATDLYKWISYGPCRVISFSGYNPSAADCFIQFHERSSAASDPLATGTVPTVKSFYAPSGTFFTYGPGDFGEMNFAELTVAVSTHATPATAQASYQPHGGTAGLNFTLIVETSYPVRSGITTMVGDLATTGRNDLRVWANTANTRRLLRLDITNGSGGVLIPIIQSIDGLPCALYKLVNTNVLPSIAIGATKTYQFGYQGGQVTDIRDTTPSSLTASPSSYVPPGRTTWSGSFAKQYLWTPAGSATQLVSYRAGSTAVGTLTTAGEYVEVGGAAIESGTISDPVTSTIVGVGNSRGCCIGLATALTPSGISAIYHQDVSYATFVTDSSCGIRAIYE